MIVDKLAWTPVRGRKVLFARSKKEPVLFYCVGGKRDAKPDGTMETDEEALMREVKEEASVELVPKSITLVKTFSGPCHGYPDGTILRMACYEAQHEGELTPSSEVEELVWFTSADMRRTTEMGQDILRWFKENNFID